MKIDIEIKRKDLTALSFYLFPRMKANWIMLVVMIFLIAAFLFITKKPIDFIGYVVLTICSILGGLVGIALGFVINLVTMLLTIGKKSGILCLHHYELVPEGIKETTEANESLHRWSSIVTIGTHGNYLLFRINNYLFHIIPRRAFENEESFKAFYSEAVRLKSSA